MADPIELASTAYSLHPDQRRRRSRRRLLTPDHPLTRWDDRLPKQAVTAPESSRASRILQAAATAADKWLGMITGNHRAARPADQSGQKTVSLAGEADEHEAG